MTMEVEDSFLITKAGVIVPSITGSISFISSITIIFIIFKSRQNSVYHRIHFVMSFFNSLSSLSIALTTLPMPKDVMVPFQGNSYGSNATCQIQGMVILIGSTIVLFMNAVLMTYYQCSIVYGMTAETFSNKKIEPVMHLISLTLSIFFVINSKYGYIGPSPKNPYCFISKYPMSCYTSSTGDRPSECFQDEEERPNTGGPGFIGIFAIISIFIYTIVTMVSILTAAMKNRKVLNRHHREQSPTEVSQSSDESTNHRSQLKEMLSVVLMYIGAFFLTWCWQIGVDLFTVFKTDRAQIIYWLQAMRICFQPLHGFYMFVIFFWHKVRNQRRSPSTEDKSLYKILKIIFASPQDSSGDRILTGLSLLDELHTLETIRRIGGREYQHQQSDLSNEMESRNSHDRSSDEEEIQSWVSSCFSIELSQRRTISSP